MNALTVLLVVICGISVESRRGGSDSSESSSKKNKNEKGEFGELFTYSQYQAMKRKRIRKEIRDITNNQWKRIANAMNLMKYIPTEEGRQNFGDDFINYDALVCQHHRATFHIGGDMAHIGPHFNIWHRAFILAFENSLISIDSAIKGLPYWDFRRDIIEQNSSFDLSNSVIFSDKYFGDYSTQNDETNFAVRNGKFAYWPINSSPAELGCTAFYQNAFGLLRSRDNIESNPYVTRYGGNVCGDAFSIGMLETYDYCLNNMTDYTEFFYCYNFDVHSRAHIGVGGSRLAFIDQFNAPFPDCVAWHSGAWTKEVNDIRKWAQMYGCFTCPTPGSCEYDSHSDSYELFQCASCNLTDGDNMCDIEGYEKMISGVREYQQIIGDFVDQGTSVNDPIFMFHHSNMDRYLMEWQLRNYEQRPYYNYPLTGFQYGVRLNDIISYQVPFANLFDDGVDIAYTIRDIWDATTFIDAPYAYDTILDLIKQKKP